MSDAGADVDAATPRPTVVQVSAGNHNACAVLSDGSLYCWGATSNGQLGTIEATPITTPTKMPFIDVVEASIGGGFICARETDGTVWCIGANDDAAVGVAPVANAACGGAACVTTPNKVTLPAKAAKLSAGYATVCVHTVPAPGATGGDVYCWGDAFAGITGDVTAAVGSVQPVPTKIATFSSDVTDLSVGNWDRGAVGDRPIACAIRADKTVWCWGANYLGGLGHAAGSDANDKTCVAQNGSLGCNAIPSKVAGVVSTVSVATGGTFACAGQSTGAAYCWGNNSNGYLGSGDTTGSPTAVQVSGLNTTVNMTAGDINVMTWDTDTNVRGWGANSFGQLALGDYLGDACPSFSCKKSATQSAALFGTKQVELRALSGIALKSDGKVYTWGSNDSGQLGHAPNTNGDTTCAIGTGYCNPTPAALKSPPWE